MGNRKLLSDGTSTISNSLPFTRKRSEFRELTNVLHYELLSLYESEKEEVDRACSSH